MLEVLKTYDRDVYEGSYVVLDFETTNIDKGDPNNPDNSLILAVWYSSLTSSWKYKWGSEYGMQELLDDVDDVDFIVAHNAKFELGWLKRCGADLGTILPFDTQIADYVYLGNMKGTLSLSGCLTRHGMEGKDNLAGALIKGGVCPSEIPRSLLLRYCIIDVKRCKQLFLRQRDILRELNLTSTLLTRCIFTPVLADIEGNGMKLDKDRVGEIYNELKQRKREVDEALDEITGGINPRSGKQVAEFLYETLGFAELKNRRGEPIRTAAGRPSTSAETIGKLRATNKKQKKFLTLKKEQAKIDGALSKYINKFKECCDENDGVLHAQFNQTVTMTHRLSSSGKKYKVQFQNFNRTFKPLFIARNEGWYVEETDGSQLEFRVAAHLGRDKQAKEDIENGVDVHSNTSRILTEAGQPTNRQDAKSHTFKPLYGGSSGTKAEQTYYAAFKERYKGIAAAQEQWKTEVLKTKKLVIETGMIFYWPDTRITESGYITNSTSICNYPVQSFATADIIPIAVTYLWHRMRDSNLKSFITNTIHDSAIKEVCPDEVEKTRELSYQAFTADVYNYLKKIFNIDFTVPLDAETVGYVHWGDKYEVAYE